MTASNSNVVATPVTERGRATLRSLLDAAEEVFGEYSFDRASISEITRRAGVAQGTFYVYFPDKRSAFVQLVTDLNHGLRRHIASAVDGIDDRLEMEREGLRAFFDYAADHRALYKIVRESEFVDEEIHRWHYETLAGAYATGLQAAMDEHQIADDVSADNLAWMLMGISELLGSRWVIMDHQPPPDEVLEQVVTFISRGFGQRKLEERT